MGSDRRHGCFLKGLCTDFVRQGLSLGFQRNFYRDIFLRVPKVSTLAQNQILLGGPRSKEEV
jgi:hypothetical protein